MFLFLVNMYYLLYLQHGTKLWAKSISYKIPLLAINSEQNYYWKLNQNQRGSEFCSAQNKLRDLQKWMFSQFFYESGHTCNPYPILFICGRHSARNQGLEGSLEVLIAIHFNLSTKQVRKVGRCDSYPKS